jgi:hypothetical protein
MKKPTIVASSSDPQTQQALEAIKENIETITGIRTIKIDKLAGVDLSSFSAGVDVAKKFNDVINKINEILDRLQ